MTADAPDPTMVAEQALLGALLLDPRGRARLNGTATEHFGDERHRKIFLALLDEGDDTDEVDAATIYARLHRNGDAESVGGLRYLNDLARNTPSAANVEAYARAVQRAARERQVAALIAEAHACAQRGDAAGAARIAAGVEEVAAEPTKAPRYRLQSVADASASDPLMWAVCDLIPARGLAVLYGAPGSGKSFVALDLGAHLSRKLPWLNRRTRRAKIIYVVLEGHIGERLLAYKKHHGLTDADLDGMRFVNHCPVDLLKTDDVDRLISDIRSQIGDHAGDIAVFMDTLSRALPGANENSSEHMGAAVAACSRIADALSALVLLVHHCGKDAAKGSRGWSGLLGACDAEMLCEHVRDSGTRTLSFTKVKDGRDGLAFEFNLDAIDIGPRSDVDPDAGPTERRTSCVAVFHGTQAPMQAKPPARVSGKNRRMLFDALAVNGPWSRKQCFDFLGAAGVHRNRRHEALNGLLVSGAVQDTIAGIRVTP